MPLLIGVDLGTTTTTAIAVDADSGEVVAKATGGTAAPMTSQDDRRKGRSEWDTEQLITDGLQTLRGLTEQLGPRVTESASIGLTGQQHGMVLLDGAQEPLTPFINWQDQRGNEHQPGEETSWVDAARERLGGGAVHRTGCRPNTGFMATTLFWMKQNDCLPAGGRAAFLSDLFASRLTGTAPVCEPSMAGSAGVLNVHTRDWDPDAIDSLGLKRSLFPDVCEADTPAGSLTPAAAADAGLPEGVPVSVSIGDHQASFVGSVADRSDSVLLNVGTGAQVAVFTSENEFEPPIELRPFPIQGNLLSNVGLAGGWSFQVLEQFIRAIGQDVFGVDADTPLYSQLTQLAATATSGSDGLVCEPQFSGTRSEPSRRGKLTGISASNLTPANLVRALLEGAAAHHREAWGQIVSVLGQRQTRLVGAGNGLRENAVLRECVEAAFDLRIQTTAHREEAAFGAALVGSVAGHVFASLEDASRIIHYAS